MNRPARFVAGIAGLVALHSARALAFTSWTHDPFLGVPVSVVTNLQRNVSTAPEGNGGRYYCWEDHRAGSSNVDIYAQRVLPFGDMSWDVSGMPICTASGNQTNPGIVRDGAGGTILVWEDRRGGLSAHLYGQRINNGPLWGVNGLPLTSGAFSEAAPKIVSDDAGGAIVVWQDSRAGGGNPDLYAQRYDATGAPLWTAGGVAVCNAPAGQGGQQIVEDEAGGAYVVWFDFRNGNLDIFAQHLSAGGTALWGATGLAVCVQPNSQTAPQIAVEGGDCYAVWQDSRAGSPDIYAQRIDPTGVARWAANGQVVTTATGSQTTPRAAVANNGLFVIWQDDRGGAPSGLDIYGQRLLPNGSESWAAGGVLIAGGTGDQTEADVERDGVGGVAVAWRDRGADPDGDVRAQRVDANGSAEWPTSAVVCSGPYAQYAPQIFRGYHRAFLVSYLDMRSGSDDVYVQRVQDNGTLGYPEPGNPKITDVVNDQGGFVKVAWEASYLDGAPYYGIYDYRVWRKVMGSDTYDLVATIPAATLPGYSAVVATWGDSTSPSSPLTTYYVDACSSSQPSALIWETRAVDGISVDNLSPLTPAPNLAAYEGAHAVLRWRPNAEADLAGYRIYRGEGASFAPGASSLVAATEQTEFVDTPPGPSVYKLSAIDVHGNESPFATLVPEGVLDATTVLLALSFAPPAPNPARGGSTFAFALPHAGAASLALYDAAGRCVIQLARGEWPAGPHAVRWEGRDAAGARAPAGLYFARLWFAGRTLERRLVVLK